MGRGMRSRADYCLVILTGRKLIPFIANIANQPFFTHDTKRQVEIGKVVSQQLRDDSENSYRGIIDLAGQ